MNLNRSRVGGRLFGLVLIVGLVVGATMSAGAASPELQDNFADRELITAPSGQIDGGNSTATREAGEPQHGGKPGARSVWISWEAPGDGVATFWTDASTFDTLLSAYYFAQPSDTTLDKLKESARNDDDPTRVPQQTSLIQFGARAGTRYEIAIDGYRGAAGDIRLRWDFLAATSPPPIVVSVPDDRAARQGDMVALSVSMQTSPDLRLQWRLNGNSFGAQGTNVVITNLQPVNLGRYTLRIDLGDVRFETTPVELQINSEGQANALARDKLPDAFDSPLLPDAGGGGAFRPASPGVTRGYNGTQIFNTAFATRDPAEPQHCGLAGSATYWYAYTAPANGTLTLDTIGSTYDTFLAVYTYNLPFTNDADLIPIACDNNSAGTNGAAWLEFAAPKSRQFLVVVDGIDGARGTAYLNYHLDTNRPPVPPTLLQVPTLRTAAAGTDVSLQPEVLGSAPLHFTWRKGTNVLMGATNSALPLTNVAPAQSGDYFVTVSSHVGSPLEAMLPLRVVLAPRMQFLSRPGPALALSFPTVTGQRYWVEHTDAIGHPWQPFTTDVLVGNGLSMALTNAIDGETHFFRVRVE